MLTVPKFATEREEADWWFDHQDLVAEEFARVKPMTGPSAAVRHLAKARGVSVDELLRTSRLNSGLRDEDEAAIELPRTA